MEEKLRRSESGCRGGSVFTPTQESSTQTISEESPAQDGAGVYTKFDSEDLPWVCSLNRIYTEPTLTGPSVSEAERCKLLYKEKCAMEKLCCEKQEVGQHENRRGVQRKRISVFSFVSPALTPSSSSSTPSSSFSTAHLESGESDH